ncbi:MAG: glutamate racemase [Ruminococcus sp.]|nr:glutamate racemase [Ruminococcus sp.]
MNNAAIGVFDSGVGGLTCVKELTALMPHENVVYLGDTARVPYGTRSRETIARYTHQDIEFLKRHDVKMILVACGTASSAIMYDPEFTKEHGEIKLSGVVIPAAHAACAATKNGRIGIIATSATIKSCSYVKAIREIMPEAKVFGKACPMFVPLVENGYTSPDCPPARFFTEEYLECMKREQVDTLILGCTHYPHLTQVISEYMGREVTLISSGAELAKYALKTLTYDGELADREEQGELELYCTDSVDLFSESVERFLGKTINGEISKCSLKL